MRRAMLTASLSLTSTAPGIPAGACGTVVSFLVIRWRAEEDAGRVPLCDACRPFARGDGPAPKKRRTRK